MERFSLLTIFKRPMVFIFYIGCARNLRIWLEKEQTDLENGHVVNCGYSETREMGSII